MTDPAKRVAIVFRGIGDIGGTNNTIAFHARRLQSLGYGVDLIGQNLGRRSIPAAMGRAVSISRPPMPRYYRWIWFNSQVERRIQRNQYAFVAGHGHNWTQDVLCLHNCLRLAHDAVYGPSAPATDPLLPFHDRLLSKRPFRLCVANSKLMRDDLITRYGMPAERIRVVYPGHDPEQFNPADRERHRDPVRTELEARGQFVIGFLTSGDFRKRGLDIVLEALASMRQVRRDHCVLLVIGKQGGTKSFRSQVQRLGLANRVRWVMPTREPQRYFHAMDLCVHAARLEEFGQSVQEAMACGVPVVTSKQVGASELLPDALRCQLPEKPSAESIRAQIEHLMEDREARRSFATQGIASVQGNSNEANFQATLDVYREGGL